MTSRIAQARLGAIAIFARGASLLPRGPADWLFAGAGLLAAVAEPRRIALAVAWAKANGAPRGRTSLAVLAYRGQVFPDYWAPVFERPADLRRRVRLVGQAHLGATAGRPVMLLGFHLGSAITSWALEAHGYTCTPVGDTRWQFIGRRRAKPGWTNSASVDVASVGTDEPLHFDGADDADSQRAVTVLRVRTLLEAGRTVRILADGPGRELFRVPVGGRELVVRAGWWHLRNMSNAVVLPVLAHREGANIVVTMYPPLPGRTSDPVADLAASRARLVAIVQAFARGHPDQCLPWRLAPGER
jgi:lauroyl/myristoyl acyltransferase